MDLGLARSGFTHVFFCESDEWRRTVLARHWPGVPCYEDVRDVAVGEPAWGAPVDGRGAPAYGRGWEAGTGVSGGLDLRDHGTNEGRGPATGDAARDSVRARQSRPRWTQPDALDLLCGGFPCQDLSVAGNRAGLNGARSGLFFEFARIIDALRPRHVLIENVPGLLSSNGGRDFGIVLGTLADLGYGMAWRVLDSRFFGVPQRRRRVFIVGADADGDPAGAARRAGEVLAVGTRCTGHTQARGEAGQDVAAASVSGTLGGRKGFTGDDIDRGGRSSLSGLGNGGPDDNDAQAGRLVSFALNAKRGSRDDGESETFVVADTLTSGSHPGSNMPGRRREDDTNLTAFHPTGGGAKGLSETDDLAPGTGTGTGGTVAVASAVGVRRLTPTECERLQGLPDGWTRLDDKTLDSRRYSGLGDAVTVPVAEWIGRRILAAR